MIRTASEHRSARARSSRPDVDDEGLLTDSTTGVTAPQPPSPAPDTTRTLPPLNLERATQLTGGSQSKVIPHAPHKSSFSVPPSSRAVNTFSVLDTDASDTLHARSANYETLLRQFIVRRPGSRPDDGMINQNPLTGASTPYSVAASTIRSGRMYRSSSAEDLRHSLTRLGSSLTIDRIRRRSNEASVNATSVDGDHSSAVPSPSRARRRLSVSRMVRKLRIRVLRRLAMLLEPVSPISVTMLVRQLLLLAALMFQLFYLPFAPTFLANSRNSRDLDWMIGINIGMEIVWLVDIALFFNSGVIDEPKASPTQPSLMGRHYYVIMSRPHIAQRYLRGAFLLDILSALPMEFVAFLLSTAGTPTAIPLVHSHPGMYHLGNTLRVLKFYRFNTSVRTIKQIPGVRQKLDALLQQFRMGSFLAVIEMIVILLLLVHYLTCAWFTVLPSTSLFSPDDQLWASYIHALVDVALLFLGDGIAAVHTLNVQGTTNLRTGKAELLLLVIVMIGAIFSAFIFARLAIVLLLDAMFLRDTDSSYQLQKSLAKLSSRMAKLELPQALQVRVKQYYSHLWNEYRVFDGDSDLLRLASRKLSAPLALEVALCRYMTTMGRMPLWRACSADLMSALIVRVEPRVYLKDDFVRRKGEIATDLLLIQRGSCEFMSSHTTTVMTSRLPSLTPSPTKSTRSGPSTPQRLGVGASMGPLALIVDYKCTAYVRATSHVEVGILTREVFQELINRFVDDRERLVRRILRAALDSSEHPMLWQFVQVYSGSNSGSPPGPGTSAAASASGAGASISVPPPLARQSTASSIQATSEKTISSRQGAKILVHAINLHSMGRHETLVLPLPLDPEAVRLPRGRERPSISRTATSSTPLRRTPTAERVTPQPTSTAVLSQPSIPQNTSTTETQIPRDLGPSVAKENDAPVGTGTNDQAIEDIIHTQAAMLHLVQTLTDSVSRLDAKLARIEERVHRTDDFTRYSANSHHHMLLRRRSSSSEGPNGLLRRQSSMNTSDAQESSHSDWRDGHLHAPRLLLPEEIAALQAAAAAFAAGPSSSSGKSHATAGQGSTRSSVSEMPSSTFDEGALDLNGVFVLSKHGMLSSPPSSRTTSQTTARHSPVKRPGIRSRSLSNSTRKRLTTFQHAITGMPITIHEPVVDTKRRASMSTLADQLWARAGKVMGANAP